MNPDLPVVEPQPRPLRWPLFWIGAALFLIGPALNFVQISFKQLWTPWYVPLLASAGVLLMSISAWQRRGLARAIGLGLFAVLCAGEWYLLAVAIKTPVYTGPAQPGHKLPEFAAVLADGSPFTNKDVENENHSVLVFNRGRW